MLQDDQPLGWLDHGICIPYPSFLRFEGVLRRDRQILHLLQDDFFAQAMSDLLASTTNELFEITSGEQLLGSSDDFRGLVAHYRNRGETYANFIGGIVDYPMPQSITPKVVEELNRLGWQVTGQCCP